MRVAFLGFELEIRFGPTTQTLIWYRKWQEKMRYRRCRRFHDTSWVLDPKYPNHRWYCCQNCKTTWLEPKPKG